MLLISDSMSYSCEWYNVIISMFLDFTFIHESNVRKTSIQFYIVYIPFGERFNIKFFVPPDSRITGARFTSPVFVQSEFETFGMYLYTWRFFLSWSRVNLWKYKVIFVNSLWKHCTLSSTLFHRFNISTFVPYAAPILDRYFSRSNLIRRYPSIGSRWRQTWMPTMVPTWSVYTVYCITV